MRLTIINLLIIFLLSNVVGEPNDDNESFKKECRYEKGPWEECDRQTGLQKRVLKLKANNRGKNTKCQPIREVTRACKNACRYNKGSWTECKDGQQFRIDKLKKSMFSQKCEPRRITNKKCKSACKYSKSEWSPCQEGFKNKTLTRLEESDSECAPTKTITKPCGSKKKKNKNQKAKHRKIKNN